MRSTMLARSLRRYSANFSGPRKKGSSPTPVMYLLRKSAMSNTRPMSAPNLPTTAAGVAEGTKKPVHDSESYPGKPASVEVGVSGSRRERGAPASATVRSAPERISVSAGGMPASAIWIWPLASAGSTSAMPLYGM